MDARSNLSLAGELRLNTASCRVGESSDEDDSLLVVAAAQDAGVGLLFDCIREQIPLDELVDPGESSSDTEDAAAEVLGASSSGVIGGEVRREEQLLPAKLPAPLSTSS